MIRRNTQLWHGRYDHCVRFVMPEASCLRDLDHKLIDKTIKSRREWGQRLLRNPGSWMNTWRSNPISDQQVSDLHAMCDFLTTDTRDRKIMLTGDTVYLYTTDLTLVQDVMSLPYVNQAEHRQTLVVGSPNTVLLKKPRYAWRSYFRRRQLTIEQKNNLAKFLEAQVDTKASPAMKHFLNSQHQTRIFDYYFVDHNDSGFITMLSLIAPDIIRRTLAITADK